LLFTISHFPYGIWNFSNTSFWKAILRENSRDHKSPFDMTTNSSWPFWEMGMIILLFRWKTKLITVTLDAFLDRPLMRDLGCLRGFLRLKNYEWRFQRNPIGERRWCLSRILVTTTWYGLLGWKKKKSQQFGMTQYGAIFNIAIGCS